MGNTTLGGVTSSSVVSSCSLSHRSCVCRGLKALPLSKGEVSGLLDRAPALPELDDGLGLAVVEEAVAVVDVELTRLCVRDCDRVCCTVLLAERSASDDAVDSLNIHWKSVDAIWNDMADDIIADQDICPKGKRNACGNASKADAWSMEKMTCGKAGY